MIIRFLLVVGLGFLISSIFLNNGINLTKIDYTYLVYTILAIGLYGGVYGIDLNEFKTHKKVIISSVTIGVILKSVIIGSLLYFITNNAISFLIGIIVAQIDPVSVGKLMGNNSKLSKGGETILRAWSSFDDPITVLLALYLALPILTSIGSGSLSIDFSEYFIELFYNILLAFSAFVLYRFFKSMKNSDIILLLLFLLLAIFFKLMLAISIIALFLRPNIEKVLDNSLSIAYYLSIALLGIFLINGFSLINGLFLAIFVVLSQMIATYLLTKSLCSKDRVYLSIGHQSGITAIILAIVVESSFSGVISIVAPAIFFINIFYYILNYYADNYYNKKAI